MGKLIIIGTGKTAIHAYEFIQMYNIFDVVGFAVNSKFRETENLRGLPVYSLENLNSEYQDSDFQVFVAILWNRLNSERKGVYEYCKAKGYNLVNLISPHSIVRGKIVGTNCWIHDFVVVQDNATIDSNVFIMAHSVIGSNSQIAPHCFFGTHSILAGGCTIGEQTFMGMNSTVFDDTQIGRKCIIGACTAVKRNMPDFSKYSTSSENIVIKQYTESAIEDKLLYSKNVR